MNTSENQDGMHSLVNHLLQLQELVLILDEHRATGDGSHLTRLSENIELMTEKLPIQLAHAEFKAHGDSTTDVPGPALTNPSMIANVKLAKSGTLQAVAYCNIHGVWQSSKAIAVQA